MTTDRNTRRIHAMECFTSATQHAVSALTSTSQDEAIALLQDAHGLWEEGVTSFLNTSDVVPPLYRETRCVEEALEGSIIDMCDDENIDLPALVLAMSELLEEIPALPVPAESDICDVHGVAVNTHGFCSTCHEVEKDGNASRA